MEIQPGKTKDRAEEEGMHTVRKRKENQQLQIYDLLQDPPLTFHASNMQDFRSKTWSQKEKMFFTKLYLEVLIGWEKGKWMPECRHTFICVNKGGNVWLQSNLERL